MDSILNILANIDEFPEGKIRDFGQPVEPEDLVLPGEVSLRAKKLHAINAELMEELEGRRLSLAEDFSNHHHGTMERMEGVRQGLESFKNDLETLHLLRKIFEKEVKTSLNIRAGQYYAIVAGWKVIENNPFDDDAEFEEAIMETDCGNPDCRVHGHLHRQAPEEPTATSSPEPAG